MSANQIAQYNAQIAQIDSTIAFLNKEKLEIVSKKNILVEAERKVLADQKEKERQEKVASEFQKQKTSVVLPKMESNDHAQIITVSCDDLTEEYQENDDVADDMGNEVNHLNMLQDHVQKQFKFGDVIDPQSQRHYSYRFVAKDRSLINTSRSHDNVVDIEDGLTVPFEICQHLDDVVSKYKNIQNSCIVSYELLYHDATVQQYDVPKDHLYEYIADDFVPSGTWSLWIIRSNGTSYKASKKMVKVKTEVTPEVMTEVPPKEEVNLQGKTVIFSGSRDNEFIQLLQEKYQVKIGTAVSKKTFAVIGKTLPTDGEKVKKAKECNVPFMTMAEFRGKFC